MKMTGCTPYMLLPGGLPLSIGVGKSLAQLVKTPEFRKNYSGALSPDPQNLPLDASRRSNSINRS